jgi:gas vesicle protein
MDNSGTKFMAFLAGAAAGALLGVLLAPERGDVTREKLSRQADQLIDDLEEQWETQYAKIKDLAGNAMSEAENLADQAESKIKNNTNNN